MFLDQPDLVSGSWTGQEEPLNVAPQKPDFPSPIIQRTKLDPLWKEAVSLPAIQRSLTYAEHLADFLVAENEFFH